MRFIHTADWHLGRYFHGLHLTADQRAIIMEQLVPLVHEEKAEAVVIAGDIYDRGVPPVEAVDLFDEFLQKMAEAKVKVFYVAGNHDSEARLNFGGRLMREAGIFVRGRLDAQMKPFIIEDEFGPLAVMLYPYMEPAAVRAVFGLTETMDFERAHEFVLAASRKNIPEGMRTLAVAHAFLAGGLSSDSERPLAVGGSSNVSPALFRDFSYTALGHLHNPQRAGADHIRYSGSLMKYSFDEAEQKKGVLVVDIDGEGKASSKFVPLVPPHDIRRIRAPFAAIEQDREKYPASEDYIEVELTDTGIILDVFNKLKAIYPNLMHVLYPNLQHEGTMREQNGQAVLKLTEETLFAHYYEDMTGEKLDEGQQELVHGCLQEIYREARDAK
ncbi:exonuclease SbcCD subunit D [uncultured Mitsuokella sp.]|uniref:exonuclease SbcCD subunit D n=1 Tax=uncultured Mitsuokella sp. TaxID=453120 RepID=UPI00266ECCA6|nr:exonuclease SbcCD subunit D [uncultured Mitsuokella sp.]